MIMHRCKLHLVTLSESFRKAPEFKVDPERNVERTRESKGKRERALSVFQDMVRYSTAGRNLQKGLFRFSFRRLCENRLPVLRDIKMDQGMVQSCAVVALIRQLVELLRECYLNMLIPTWPVEAYPSKRSVHPRSLRLALSIRFGNRKARQAVETSPQDI